MLSAQIAPFPLFMYSIYKITDIYSCMQSSDLCRDPPLLAMIQDMVILIYSYSSAKKRKLLTTFLNNSNNLYR